MLGRLNVDVTQTSENASEHDKETAFPFLQGFVLKALLPPVCKRLQRTEPKKEEVRLRILDVGTRSPLST